MNLSIMKKISSILLSAIFFVSFAPVNMITTYASPIYGTIYNLDGTSNANVVIDNRLNPSNTESCLINQSTSNPVVDNTITVYGGTNYITINNLNIIHSGTVIDIENNATVYLTLEGTNTISDDFAGATTAFIVSSGSNLYISSNSMGSADSLNIIARHGNSTGIGGASTDATDDTGGDCGNIDISSGKVTTSLLSGTGIGGGFGPETGGNGGHITISGGTVINNVDSGFSIGAGLGNNAGYGNRSNITISGGTVTNSSPIEAGSSHDSSIIFSGGSINSTTDIYPTYPDSRSLTPSVISLPSAIKNQEIDFINITQDGNSYYYGSTDVYTDSNGRLYLWIPTSSNDTIISINIGSYSYIYNETSSGTIVKSFSVDDIPDQTFTGSQITPNVNVKFGDDTLIKDTDYTVSYGPNINSGTDAGSVTITGIGNYAGTVTKTFNINPINATFSVDNIPDQTYTGRQITPNVTVKSGSTTLTKDTDYTVSYGPNINSGTNAGSVTITGIGNYAGTVTKTFNINPAVSPIIIPFSPPFSANDIPAQTYTGSQITPDVIVKSGSTILKKDIDYKVTYGSNINSGTAAGSISVIGIGNFAGCSDFKRFNINPINTTFSVDDITDQTFTGSQITPSVNVKFGNTTLTKDTDYTVTYGSNINSGTAAGKVNITGIGNYAGSYGSKTFNINPKPLNLLLSASTNDAHVGNTITLKACFVNAPDLLNGTVTFKNGSSIIASNVPFNLINGEYCALAYFYNIPFGTLSFTAEYIPNISDNYCASNIANSNSLDILKLNQTGFGFNDKTITKNYGDSSFSINALGGQSTGNVNYVITSGNDVVSLNGNKVSLLKPGTATITAIKAGDDKYNSTSCSITINVNKPLPQITQLQNPTSANGSVSLTNCSTASANGSAASANGSAASANSSAASTNGSAVLANASAASTNGSAASANNTNTKKAKITNSKSHVNKNNSVAKNNYLERILSKYIKPLAAVIVAGVAVIIVVILRKH